MLEEIEDTSSQSHIIAQNAKKVNSNYAFISVILRKKSSISNKKPGIKPGVSDR